MALNVDLEQLLQHREFLTSLARALVIDPSEQDELVWETMGEGAMCPPQLQGKGHATLKPWLARVLRNRASNRNRARLRRQKHEAVGAQAEAIESAAELAARFELVQVLSKHVQALDPDDRDVVLFRFFEDLPPREIAKRLFLPVETVKARLRRALTMLRARLDKEHGSRDQWLGVLVPLAFPSAKTVGVGFTILGAVLMMFKTKAALAGLTALLLLVAGIFYGIGQADEVWDEGAGSPAAVIQKKGAEEIGGGQRSQPSDMGSQDRGEVLDQAPLAFEGRCVDQQGRPLAGCSIDLLGNRPAAPSRRGEADEDRVEWVAPRPVRTGPDGRFEVRSRLDPAWNYRLLFRAKGFAALTKRWSRRQRWEGALDLGEIEMLRTCRLYGRVLDEKGRPRADLYVSLSRGRRGWGTGFSAKPQPPYWATARTAADGSFKIREGVTEGFWEIGLDEQEEILGSKDLVIEPGQSDVYLEIRIRNAEDFETIAGLVSDSSGAGIEGVSVVYPYPDQPNSGGSVTTDREGRFEIRRTRQLSRPTVALRFQLEGYEILRTDVEFAHGHKERRFVLERADDLRVRVKDALTGQPIEFYGYSLEPLGTAQGGKVFRNYGRQLQGRDPGVRRREGVLLLQGLAKGVYDFQIVPGEPYLRSARIKLVQPRDGDLEVVLTRAVEQPLQVLSMDGKALPGCRVELLESLYGLPIDFQTWIADTGINSSQADFAVCWSKGESDEEGRVLLKGPPDRDLSLRIHAPGHVRKLVHGIRLLEGDESLVVRLQQGATLEGVIGPVTLLDRLERQGLRAARDSGFSTDYFRPGLRLVRSSPEESIPSGHRGRVFFEKDGSYSIKGIPPGTWRLELTWIRNWQGGTGPESHSAGEVIDLKDGETRRLSLSLPDLVPAEVAGKVTWNGKAVPQAGLVFEKLTDTRSESPLYFPAVPLKADGGYSWLLSPGNYMCRLRFHGVDRVYPNGIPLGRVLRIPAGGKLALNLDFLAGLLKLRLRDEEGRPVSGRRLYLRSVGSPFYVSSPATDKNGQVELLVPSGSIEVLIAPRSLATKSAEAEFRRKHQPGHAQAWARALLSIAQVQVGSTGLELECKLPRK